MKIKKSARTSFDQAHEEFKKGLILHASFKVRNGALCDDLVQDTFIKTWVYMVKGGEIVKMKAFLYHVLNGLIIDEYRKRKNSSLDLLIENGFDPQDDTTERTVNVFDGKIAIKLINKLPKSYQPVMRMRFVKELSLAEIAEITGKSKNTTAVHVHRGLEKLRYLYDTTSV